jgi:hypothetical protein
MLAKTESIITHSDWLERAERVAAEIAGCAADHDRDDSFVEEGFAALKRGNCSPRSCPPSSAGAAPRPPQSAKPSA